MKGKFKMKPTAASGAGKGLIKGKAGKIIGKIGGLAARWGNLIPGVGGIVSTVGKVAESVNDPEWWRHVPSTGVSTNVPLQGRGVQPRSSGSSYALDRAALLEFTVIAGGENAYLNPGSSHTEWPISYEASQVRSWATQLPGVIAPTNNQIATYVMNRVREVVNAIPLQNTWYYVETFTNAATAYALKHCFDKYIHLAKSSKPFLPTMTDGSYPILTPENYAVLVGMRDRLAEYCKANVRLPHTLCQYLAWRFGRVYRTGESAKCGIVMYDIIPLNAKLVSYQNLVNAILGFATSTSRYYWSTAATSAGSRAQAFADLFNTYKDHVQDVEVKEDTQFMYDRKEFVLRTNLDALLAGAGEYPNPDFIYMDSELDNETTFIASTVSTVADFTADPSYTNVYPGCLFPVRDAIAHLNKGDLTYANYHALYTRASQSGEWDLVAWAIDNNHPWLVISFSSWTGGVNTADNGSGAIGVVMFLASLAKSLEYYNVELYAPGYFQSSGGTAGQLDHVSTTGLDVTTMSQDLALVSNEIIANTQTYAFANLVFMGVHSYAAENSAAAYKDADRVAEEIVEELAPASK